MESRRMTREQRRMYRRKIIEQRLLGLGMLACCVLALWLCSTGATPEDQDATALVVLLPMALYMLFTKKVLIY